MYMIILGEMGTGVNLKYDHLTADEKRKVEELYKLHGFNAYVSNLISVNRTLPDMRSERYVSLYHWNSLLCTSDAPWKF